MRAAKRFFVRRRASVWLGLTAASVAALVGIAAAACGNADALTVYSGRSEALVGELIARFEAESGIDVAVRYADTNLLAATLLEEGAATDADVFFAQAPSALAAVAVLLGAAPETAAMRVPAWAVGDDERWVGTSARVRTVVYNSDKVDASELPDSIEAFADQKWRGRIGWAPANSSFQAMVAAMISEWGQERTREWLEGVVTNNPAEYPSNTTTVNGVVDGEVDVGFVNHYYLHRVRAERGADIAARNHYLPPDDPGATLLVAGAGILKNTDKRAAAEEFVNFLLSEPAQSYFAETNFELPLNADVDAPSAPMSEGAPALSDLSDPLVDFSDIADINAVQALLREVKALP